MVSGMGFSAGCDDQRTNRRLRRQENGKMEAGEPGRAALDAPNCRKSEMDIFLYCSPSIARVADEAWRNPVLAADSGGRWAAIDGWIERRLAMANVWNPEPVAEHMRCCWTAGPGRRFNEDAGRPSRWPSQASGMDKRGYFRSMMTDRRVIDRSDPTRRQIKEQGQA